jgi:hypothetical protein
LNSTGLDLTKVDLLRNYFLMQFDHDRQTKLYEDYWCQIEDIIGTDRMEQFFVDYLIFRKRSDSITINGRNFTHTYSGSNCYVVRDGIAYEEAYDPTNLGRTYTEGDEIPTAEATEEDYAQVGRIMMGGVTTDDDN